ncbi:YqeG family HAD IIIA-type phosphatase [Heliobacterium gestii]|uniref:YqeG family HAD IIIA-type phosphatase n=1 Tax=Heliomicrobium gestii TaxID=2699 RepID=A0A845LFT8_HELGE|nr:YqeG family HAD IIIA-type phosphatase [Heliomicrobium gestii]MBM7867883.1 HAD superfamily phosphatase (TIGR01668 family) [Heliomicrobium gestii]MZP43305.1 YqeG family HAD IIIA-type phosphatase [Heliomicrobium gestii]
MKILKPARRVDAVPQVNVAELAAQGVQGVIIDLDNTLTEWNQNHLCPEIARWLEELRRHGIKICILSNNKEKRVQAFAEACGAPYISNARKPRRRGFLRAMSLLGITAEHTVVIGDQVFTDVLGGNRSGLHTILVNPISRREFLGTRLVRRLERLVLRERQPHR